MDDMGLGLNKKGYLVNRSLWIVGSMALVAVVAIALLLFFSWRGLQRQTPIQEHLSFLTRTQQVAMVLQEIVVTRLNENDSIEPEELTKVSSMLDALISSPYARGHGTPVRLKAVRDLIGQLHDDPIRILVYILDELGALLTDESIEQTKLQENSAHDARVELESATLIGVSFALLVLFAVLFFRNGILRPLAALSNLMARLTQKDYRRVEQKTVDPILQPLFDNYNTMVSRLEELEAEHVNRQSVLERQVRVATRTAIGQQIDLARAQKLAAIGEISAGVAHELRNPLAGVRLAIENLRIEWQDSEYSRRLEQIGKELDRIARLSSELLAQSRHTPEAAVELDLSSVLSDMLELARYQIPERVEIRLDVQGGISCNLPENGLRQCVLNLIINSAQAIGDDSGAICIGAEVAQGRLSLRVVDDGPGFSAIMIEKGVRAFVTGREEGTGLGLAMVRRFVHDNGGELRLKNVAPHGASVTIEFGVGVLRG